VRTSELQRPVHVPSSLCFGGKSDTFEPGEIVIVIEAVGEKRLRVMTLAGPMVIDRDDVAPGPWEQELLNQATPS
jgi:hypothetical protein